MNLFDAIASDTEFAPWMDGDRRPVTVLVAAAGTNPVDMAPGLREGLARLGLPHAVVDASDKETRLQDGVGALVAVGPLMQAVAMAMPVPGAVAIVPHGDLDDIHDALAQASNRLRSSRGLAWPGLSPDPELQHACSRVQIIAALDEAGTEILPGGLFFAHGLDLAPYDYAPGSPWRPDPPKWNPDENVPEPEERDEPLDVDLDKVAAWVSSTLEIAYLPTWREHAPGDAPDRDGTGSEAFIPAGTDWPTCEGHPLAAVVHLRVDGLPEPVRALLGGAGLFQFFCSLDGVVPDESEGWLARVVDPDAAGAWSTMPRSDRLENLGAGRVITGWREVREVAYVNEEREGALIPFDPDETGSAETRVVEALSSHTFGEDRLPAGKVAEAAARHGLDPVKAEAVADILRHYRRDKLLGWPSWEQGAEWPDEGGPGGMVLLLQMCFDSDDALAPSLIASDGSLQVFVSTDGERRFAFRWACG